MTGNTRIVVLTFFLLALNSARTDDMEYVQSWTDAAAEILVRSARASYEGKLVASGLALSDVDRIITAYGQDAARCLAIAVRSISEQKQVPFKSLVRKDSLGYINAMLLEDHEFLRVAEVCTLTALENAGISVDQ